MAAQNPDTSLACDKPDKPEVEVTVKVASTFMGHDWSFVADLPDDMITFHSGRLQYTKNSPFDFSQSAADGSDPSDTWAFAPDLPTNSSSLPMVLFPSPLSLPQDPSIHHKTSRLYTDGRPPASYNDLPSEVQLKILAPILIQPAPISAATRTKYARTLFLSLQLVNKRMRDQARHLYQENRFILVHGLDYTESQTPTENIPLGYSPFKAAAFQNKILRVPHPCLCHRITTLEIRIFPQAISGKGLLTDPYSFAPLFRYRRPVREAKLLNPFDALDEATNARRIAWQSTMTSVRSLKVTFDFARSQDSYDKLVGFRRLLSGVPDTCYDRKRRGFVAFVNTLEAAFPRVVAVEVEVMNLLCLGRNGMWSRGQEEEQRPEEWWEEWCEIGCARKVGMAFERALKRNGEREV